MKPSERIKDIADGYVANYPEAIMFFLDEQAELLETHTVKEPCNEQGPHYCKFGGYSLHVQAPSHTVKEGGYETRT